MTESFLPLFNKGCRSVLSPPGPPVLKDTSLPGAHSNSSSLRQCWDTGGTGGSGATSPRSATIAAGCSSASRAALPIVCSRSASGARGLIWMVGGWPPRRIFLFSLKKLLIMITVSSICTCSKTVPVWLPLNMCSGFNSFLNQAK